MKLNKLTKKWIVPKCWWTPTPKLKPYTSLKRNDTEKLVSVKSNNRPVHPITKMYYRIMRHTRWEQKQKAIMRCSPVKRGVLEMKNIHSWRCHRSLEYSLVTNNPCVGSNLMGSKILVGFQQNQKPKTQTSTYVTWNGFRVRKE